MPTKNAVKNQLRNIMHDENHIYGKVFVHLASNQVLKASKQLQEAEY